MLLGRIIRSPALTTFARGHPLAQNFLDAVMGAALRELPEVEASAMKGKVRVKTTDERDVLLTPSPFLSPQLTPPDRINPFNAMGSYPQSPFPLYRPPLLLLFASPPPSPGHLHPNQTRRLLLHQARLLRRIPSRDVRRCPGEDGRTLPLLCDEREGGGVERVLQGVAGAVQGKEEVGELRGWVGGGREEEMCREREEGGDAGVWGGE